MRQEKVDGERIVIPPPFYKTASMLFGSRIIRIFDIGDFQGII
jgi:hypothetical protein